MLDHIFEIPRLVVLAVIQQNYVYKIIPHSVKRDRHTGFDCTSLLLLNSTSRLVLYMIDIFVRTF